MGDQANTCSENGSGATEANAKLPVTCGHEEPEHLDDTHVPLMIRGISGDELAEVSISEGATIRDVKQRIHEMCGLESFQLLLGEHVLQDSEAIATLGLPKELLLVRVHFKDVCRELFDMVADGAENVGGKQAFTFFIKSGCRREDLRGIWNLANTSGGFALDFEEFCIALKLIAHVQAGHNLDGFCTRFASIEDIQDLRERVPKPWGL
mmetsp:Transcript_161130/g.283995  ORF Transcript_161130/g.283995 Transcript_161130/m.283995 type:complete len:209 (+) Transcript_161130:54-680(+)